MAPNLLVASQTLLKPHKWFKSSKSERSTRTIEEWTHPVPGRYEYVPGRGWYLIATPKDASTNATELKVSEGGPVLPAESPQLKEYTKLDCPVQVHKSKALPGRWFLDPDYRMRKKQGTIKNERGKQVEVGFFQLDDGVAWVQCWDEEGNFTPPDDPKIGYKRWCIDAQTKQFRHMLKRDDPNFIRSRNNSSERDADTHSQDSMSAVSRSGPASARDGLSAPSTSANSIRLSPSNPSSRGPSQRPSRQSSPNRNNSIPLEEAKAALRRMAREHEEAVAAAAAARARTTSGAGVERIERGRPTARVGS